MPVRALILRAPGANCDLETAYAFEQAGAVAERVHVNRWLESPRLAEQFQILCIPGGFSYGDDVSAGRILATRIRRHLQEGAAAFVAAGKLVLGICNGFQVLIKSGLLLADEPDGQAPATLTWNDSGRFDDRWVQLRTAATECVFLRGIESLYLPIAHAEGKLVARSEAALDQLERAGQLALLYASDPTPQNPNGSQRDVAGICDPTGRVFGLMPHPERFIDPTQHPRWTRERPAAGDGAALFENAVRFFK